jgi:hypothetical protein
MKKQIPRFARNDMFFLRHEVELAFWSLGTQGRYKERARHAVLLRGSDVDELLGWDSGVVGEAASGAGTG